MSPGYQGVQGMHAAIQFMFEHPEFSKEWFVKSNYLGFLSTSNEDCLKQLIEAASKAGVKFSIFREPDIGDQITAIALEPGSKAKKLCSKLPLALRSAS